MKKIFCQGWEWNLILFSVFIAMILPELAGIGIIIVLIRVFIRDFWAIIRSRLNQGLGIITLWLMLSASLSPTPIDAWIGLGNFLPFFFFFINIRQLIQKPSQLRQLAWAMVIPSLWVVVMGWGQIFLGWQKPEVLKAIFTWPYGAGGEPLGRMSSVFMYANLLGAYLVVTLILALGLFILTVQQWQRQRNRHLNLKLGLLTLTIFLDSLGLFLTNSRNAWALAFLAGLIFALYLGWNWLVAGFALLGGIISLASWGPNPLRDSLRLLVPSTIWARLSDEMVPDRPLATLRSTQWRFTLEMTQERPLLGWGLRSFTPLYEKSQGVWLGHPHNLYLMLMAETGIIGLILLSVWVGWIYAQGVRLFAFLRQQKAGGELIIFTYLVAFGACILFNTVDVTLSDVKINTIVWFLLAAIAGLSKPVNWQLR
jgi:O-antigen ligase